MDQSKKERLRRLSELNMRSLGVSSFEAPQAGPVVGSGYSTARELLSDIRKRKSYVCQRSAEKSGSCSDGGRLSWVRKYYNL